ncbi:XkdQ/YqbQ family protein [Paenibacillus kobensis]|uniref:XkdQ/YqbQ family protein n=1 Tax=Paenibacillus kobensis TaxID=59841 RepID=UPI000FD8F722|nr:hypothetical protein [Paenibacillus kobensis]
MTWTVIYGDKDRGPYELNPVVKTVKWSGDIQQAARKLVVELANTRNGKERFLQFDKGAELSLLSDGKELFRGIIFADEIDAGGQMSLTAYDENIYLTKNKDTQIFRNQSASSIVKRLCNQYAIPMGQIDDTGFIIPKLIYRDKTLYEMMITSLTVSEKQNGKRFYIVSREGKLHLLARKDQEVRWVLENGSNILSASYSQSIEDMRTQVKVIGGDPEKKAVSASAKDPELTRLYGTMQHLEKPEQDMTPSRMEQLAKQRLKDLATIGDEARLECLGIADVTSGSAIYVSESMTGIRGGYYVSADEHAFEGGSHRMSLTLSATDDLPKMEYEDKKGAKPS